ncbi:MAG: HAMP domain-containing protein, partial [Candidatus Eisenbacteria bacterium]|nr:HAMP domain-containing protein [Candidatus Eisenbacteria bacterium]
HWVKIGLAPIAGGADRVAPLGVLVIQAPSRTLPVVARMRGTLLAVSLVLLAVVLVVALWVSRAATRRIRRLVAAAERIGRGDLDSPVAAQGGDEIGVLAESLESMRAAVQVRDRQLRAMVGGVAHEIRNPLGGLLLFAEMLAGDASLHDTARQRARRILTETARLERVVAEFLTFARPESPHGEATELGPALRQSAESAAGALGWSGRWEIRGDEAREVWCDPDHLRQIALNLIQNAMQATLDPPGRVRIAIEPAAGARIVRIEDSGSGIAPQKREEVFEPFFTTRSSGAGLGLAIVKRLCDLNRIAVEIGTSQWGGAAFVLHFPRPPAARGGGAGNG